jgi:hypothetical protein
VHGKANGAKFAKEFGSFQFKSLTNSGLCIVFSEPKVTRVTDDSMKIADKRPELERQLISSLIAADKALSCAYLPL